LGGADEHGEDGIGMGTIEEDICWRTHCSTPLEPGVVTVNDEGTMEARKEKGWVLETNGVNFKTI